VYFPELETAFRALLADLQGQRVLIAGHMRPDGDCIGSQVALCRVLRSQGVDAVAVNADAVPKALTGFVADTPFIQPAAVAEGDWAFLTVDCADNMRYGKDLRERFPVILGQVDHHLSNTQFAQHNLVDQQAAATAEMLTGLFLDSDLPIDAVTAQALYAGIATDTGQFRFPNTTPRVFELSSALIERGASPADAARAIYENAPFAKMKLLQAFLDSLELCFGGRVCIGKLNEAIFRATGASPEDTEGLVDYARCIEGVEVGILLEEREGAVKGSFRAKEEGARVDLLAKAFDGGGHACAAGFFCREPIDTMYPRLLKLLEENLDNKDG